MSAAASPSTTYLILSLVQIALCGAGMVLILQELRELVRQLGLVRVALAEHQRHSDERLTRLEEAQPDAPTPARLSLRASGPRPVRS
ncbi:hypothetical protein SAMN02745121_08712 [Nannocystis exedens]|uniref:Uncharacterized protein n=1 Tax=Nannocystis exedens TaxID=54 RepID=A0A1I2IL15_9BACT|nr:hypothetical protein [Nannocystis exedens]PCC73134.1 hypothetical protein NAEX_06222 [Nannocystis exedens]SFF41546.1 hypothetical protein SAMN02745121_08712 [Nannocystis exedens]